MINARPALGQLRVLSIESCSVLVGAAGSVGRSGARGLFEDVDPHSVAPGDLGDRHTSGLTCVSPFDERIPKGRATHGEAGEPRHGVLQPYAHSYRIDCACR